MQAASPAALTQLLKVAGQQHQLPPLSPELAAAAAAAAAANAAGDPLTAVQRLAAALAAAGGGGPQHQRTSSSSNNNNNNNGEAAHAAAVACSSTGDDDMKIPPAISLPGAAAAAAGLPAAAAAAAAGLPVSPELLWRLPNPFIPGPPPSPLDAQARAHLPCGLPQDPRTWTREDVAVFMRYCEREFDLEKIDMEKFQMNGENPR